jgi:multiple sugar transport system substrate-binding protein
VQGLTGLEPDDQFLNDPDTALTLSGPWLYAAAQRVPELRPQLGLALPPGPPFVGGSYLVVWKHTTEAEAALQWIRHLTQPRAQVAYSQGVGLLPARLEALAMAPFATEPVWQLAIQGIRAGRSFPVTRSWGLMEDRLTRALAAIWQDVLAQPEADVEALVIRHLEPLAKRLDLVLGQS